MFDFLYVIVDWANSNSGFLSLILFLVALFLGWISGVFKNFVQKPCFRIRQLSGPNCCAVLSTGKIYNESPVHRTAISIYLRVTNTGNVSSSIDNVEAAFHWHLKPFSLLWLRYRFFWCWIRQPAVSLDPFMVSLGEQQKIYPFFVAM